MKISELIPDLQYEQYDQGNLEIMAIVPYSGRRFHIDNYVVGVHSGEHVLFLTLEEEAE